MSVEMSKHSPEDDAGKSVACTCNPYFGCSEYAPDCPRHGTASRVIPPDPSPENDVHPHLWERLLPVLNDAVGNGQLTRDEAFAVLDSLGRPRPIPPGS